MKKGIEGTSEGPIVRKRHLSSMGEEYAADSAACSNITTVHQGIEERYPNPTEDSYSLPMVRRRCSLLLERGRNERV